MQISNENAIIERIKELRNRYAGSRGKSKFARALGISASTYNYYENNRVPPPQILLRICEVTGSEIEWLLTGERSEKKPASGPNDKLLQKLDYLFTEHPELNEAVLAFIELLCEKKEIEQQIHLKVSPPDTRRPGWIPVLGRTAAGIIHFWNQEILPDSKQAITELDELVKKHLGKEIVSSADGTMSVDLQGGALLRGLKENQVNLIQVCGQQPGEVVEFVQCEQVHKLFPDSFALRIDGDSMSPKINDGDIVILSPSVSAAQGQLAVAHIARQIGVTCKLIRTTENDVHLIPVNEKYETKIVAKKELLWALAVLCHVRV